MPEEGKADRQTPADRRRRQRSAGLVFGFLLAVVLAALAATVLAVNDGRNYKRLVRQLALEQYLLPALAAPQLRVGRHKSRPPERHYPPWLLKAGLERMAVFEKTAALSAAERCDLLRDDRGTAPTFSRSGEGWECLFFKEFGNGPEPAALFIQARGTEPDIMSSFRIKVSLTDLTAELAVLSGAIGATERFGLPMTPETRTYLVEKLAGRTEFSSIVENYRMTFSREISDARRYNLLILPRRQAAGCGEHPSPPPDRWTTPVYRMPVGCLALRSLCQPQSAS
ncbi:DUF6030 family protein [Neorhizobium galegae]|uniref:DUF6030 family protein n=1 Tax=Neorhizobium galegae TaxID=399 RepID=UPI0006216E91|nr:DUF6030 family protein [Neorhizobium galegae]MCQ1767703.1 DUF6030 family protein [Neorhizobium galegae]MCQ1848042.1 DUF6030 family protein [Neorhizobium galegae]CDZ42871.1 Hypothetical protein NGAL_HAMBI1146_56420 [Neorhizobium galegae bv. officinalis]